MASNPIYVLARPDKAIVVRMFPPPCSTCRHYSAEMCKAFGEPRPSVHARMMHCNGLLHSSVQRELAQMHGSREKF